MKSARHASGKEDSVFLQRIAELEGHFRMTSEQAIAQAVAGTQPADPLFVEWLVLLDRGDLV